MRMPVTILSLCKIVLTLKVLNGQEINDDNDSSITINQLTIILETSVLDTFKRYARS